MRRPGWLAAFAAVVVVGAVAIPLAAAASAELTAICHARGHDDDQNASDWLLLKISANAVDHHLAHGDGLPGEVVPGTDGQLVFDENCIPQASALVHAVAYTDVNTADGAYDPDVDVLIAKLIDGPGAANDGIPGAGDLVITNQYPKGFAASSFGDFTVTEHVVDTVFGSSQFCIADNAAARFAWSHVDPQNESYSEVPNPFDLEALTLIDDGLPTGANDRLKIEATSPSEPVDTLEIFAFDSTDQAFIDVELNCGD